MTLILLIVNFLLLIFKNKICNFFGLIDIPNTTLKNHHKNVPIFGGIFFLINILVFFFIDYYFQTNSDLSFFFNNTKQIFASLMLLSIITAFGIYDDKYFVTPWRKTQILLFIFFLFLPINSNLLIEFIYFDYFYIQLGTSKILFSILCYFFLLNAFNFYDGVNCNLLSLFLILNIYFYLLTKIDIYLFLSFLTAIALIFNYKNYFFLGDGGAYLLSLITSISLVNLNQFKNLLSVEDIILLVFYPTIDLIRVSFRRVLNGVSPFNGDLSHIHHLLCKKIGLIKYLILMNILYLSNISILHYFNNYVIYAIFLNLIIYFSIILKAKP